MADFTLLYAVGSFSLHILTEWMFHKALNIDEKDIKWKGPPINHDLEKAFQRSFFSALQMIVIDCQKQSKPEDTLGQKKWLDQKFKQLAEKLSAIESSKSASKLFDSLDHLQSFLVADLELAQELKQEEAKERLIELALKDDSETPSCYYSQPCYYSQVEARLFEEVRDHFIREIKFNEPVRNILMAGGLAEMTAKINRLEHGQTRLEHGQTEMMKLLTELRDFRAATSWQAKIKMDIDLTSDLADDQILAIIKASKQGGLKTLRVEAGSVIVVMEGSEAAIRQLENLTEIAGYRIEKLTIIPGYPSTSLFKWLHKQFEDAMTVGWKTLEEIFGYKELAFRSDKTQRAKEFDLGNGTVVILLVQVEEKEPDIQVTLEVRAKDKGILPAGLTLLVSQETGESQTTQANEGNNYLQQEWVFSRQESFTVTLSLGNVEKTELFVFN